VWSGDQTARWPVANKLAEIGTQQNRRLRVMSFLQYSAPAIAERAGELGT
jgi:hypothetical protein